MPVDPHAQEKKRGNLLILYDERSVFTNTVREHLECFSLYSGHNVFYCNAVNKAPLRVALEMFDAVIIHYSVRLAVTWHLSPAFAAALQHYRGVKALFIQDEYENTWQASDWINQLGIQVVFTCVPTRYVPKIYSRVNPGVEFITVLTGYVPVQPDLRAGKPLKERPIDIGYRGRALPTRYGLLAREKLVIGQRMRAFCEERGLRHDIEWTDDKRIYGDSWVEFVASCRATLGTESGSNIFDFDGTLAETLARALKAEPTLTFEDLHERYLKDRETEPIMNQVSPRIFEAVTLRTGLVLFEGTYSGVVRPDEHFIPLKKDFSNVGEVLEKVQDNRYMETMIERAYHDVIHSGAYTYERFVKTVMDVLEPRMALRAGPKFAYRASGCLNARGTWVRLDHANLFMAPVDSRQLPEVPISVLLLMTVSALLRRAKLLLRVPLRMIIHAIGGDAKITHLHPDILL